MKLDELGIFEWGALAGAMAAAARTGLMAELVSAEAPLAAATLAERAGCHAEAAERVLQLLACTGLLVASEASTWRLSTSARDAFAHVPGGLAAFVALYAHTPRFLSDGTRWSRLDGDARERAAVYADAVDGLAALFARAAHRLAAALPPARGAILDVGAGSGVWSLAMAEQDAGLCITALDFEAVLPRFYARAVRLGLAGRVDAMAGDYHELALPHGSYARVVLANVLHLETEADAAALVAHAAAALAPGGRLVIADVWDGDTARQRLAQAAYALHLAMRSAVGRPHPRERLLAWVAAAGLEVEGEIDLHAASPSMSALWSSPR